MNSIEEILPVLEVLIKGLGKHFGEKYEFVVHDYLKDFSSSVVAIENGELTGRRIGDSGTKLGLRIYQGVESGDGQFHHTIQAWNGRRFNSSTIYLKNDGGEVIGSLCINFDVSELLAARNTIDCLIGAEQQNAPQEEHAVISSIEDMLNEMIKESLEAIGTPVANMTRAQKMEGIQYLNRRGAFKIKNAANIVAQCYDISRYTVYNYINNGELGI